MRKFTLFTLLLLMIISEASGGESVIALRVSVNREIKGDFFLKQTGDGDILLSLEDLTAMGFEEIPPKAQLAGNEDLSLSSLAPELIFRVDEEFAMLVITADPHLLTRRTIDLKSRTDSDLVPVNENTAFLNYHLNVDGSDSGKNNNAALLWETGVRAGQFLGFSGFSWSKNRTEDRVVRLMSSITADSPSNIRRLVLGDFSASSGSDLGSGGVFGGISVSKNFSLSPYFTRYPELRFTGVVETPSEVELFINDTPVAKQSVSPGEFEFLHLPPVAGSGNITMVVKDAFGKRTKVVRPFSLSFNLLKPGIQEYSYNLGFRREGLGQKNFKYSDLEFLASHRAGVTRKLTAGMRVQAGREFLNGGPTINLQFGTGGELNSSLAFSTGGGNSGYGAVFRYLQSYRSVHFRSSFSFYSAGYRNTSKVSSGGSQKRWDAMAGAGGQHKTLGSLSISYLTEEFYRGEIPRQRGSINYSHGIGRGASLNITASRTSGFEVADEIFAMINFSLGSSTATLEQTYKKGERRTSASFQNTVPSATGFGYRARVVSREENGNYKGDGDGSLEYRGSRGVISADYSRWGGTGRYVMRLSGGVSYIDGGIFFSRPLNNSFALVKTGGLEGVEVRLNNREVGRTDSNGEILVPDLIPYYDNMLTVTPGDLPMNYSIKETAIHVMPAHRSGVKSEFKIEGLFAYEGFMYLSSDGKRVPAEFSTLIIKTDKEDKKFVVGKKGQFYIENISDGKYPATLYSSERNCSFQIVIPAPEDELITNMGEIECGR